MRNIDILKLAGIGSILGIDITDKNIHIVELKRKGSPFNKFAGNFVVTKSITGELSSPTTVEEKSKLIKELLSNHKISCHYAVSTVQGAGAKTIMASLPRSITNIDEWIREHYESLLKLHVPIDQLSFGFEIISQTESTSLIEISFVRNSEIAELRSLFKSTSLELLALGVGTRDALNSLVVSDPSIQDAKFVYVAHEKATWTTLSQKKRVEVRELRLMALVDEFAKEDKPNSERIIISGYTEERATEGGEILQPLGLPTEFTLAVGLAVKGFLDELSPVNLLSGLDKKLNQERVIKSLTQRVVLTLGVALILIIAVELSLSTALTAKISDLDERAQVNASGASYLKSLEREIAVLEGSFKEDGGSLKRSNYSKMLHDVASAAPESVWLTKMSVRDNDGTTLISLHGFASSDDFIAHYLKNLDRVAHDVELVRSGSPAASENIKTIGYARPKMVGFEIRATF